MFCKNCGKPVDDNVAVCPYCGTQTAPANAQAAAPAPEAPAPAPAAPEKPAVPAAPAAPAAPVAETKNTMAIVGFVFSFFIPIVGLICSIIGLKKVGLCGGNGKGLAIAGIVISILSWVFTAILSYIWILPLLNEIMSSMSMSLGAFAVL